MDAHERLVRLGELSRQAAADDDLKFMLTLIATRERRTIGEIARDDEELFTQILAQADEMRRLAEPVAGEKEHYIPGDGIAEATLEGGEDEEP